VTVATTVHSWFFFWLWHYISQLLPYLFTTMMLVIVDDCSGGSHFDGASFGGGIIFAVGMILIIYFAVRYWQARKRGTVWSNCQLYSAAWFRKITSNWALLWLRLLFQLSSYCVTADSSMNSINDENQVENEQTRYPLFWIDFLLIHFHAELMLADVCKYELTKYSVVCQKNCWKTKLKFCFTRECNRINLTIPIKSNINLLIHVIMRCMNMIYWSLNVPC